MRGGSILHYRANALEAAPVGCVHARVGALNDRATRRLAEGILGEVDGPVVPCIKPLPKGRGEIVAGAPLAGHTVAKLVWPLPVAICANVYAVAPGAAVVGENAIYQTRLRGVAHRLCPELTHTGLGPVECGNAAVDVTVVAQRQNFARLVAQKGVHTGGL